MEKHCRRHCRADEIHLWAIDLAALSAGDILSDAERRRARRIRDREKRDLYLGGRCGLRLLLSAYSGVANDELRFEYGARGKPKLAGGDLNFNYTLSGGKALYALVCRREIGVDLETLPREIAAERHSKRNLSDAEKRAWNRLPTAHKNHAMLACWTRKEAYGKALGVGIRFFMNRVTVCADFGAPVWQTPVAGMFDSGADRRVLHGMQIGLPFAGVAALVYDGAAITSVRGWWLRG